MDTQNATAQTEQNEGTQNGTSLVRPWSFTFRKIKEPAFKEFLGEFEDEVKPAIEAQFDKINEGTEENPKFIYRRKPVDIKVNLPEFILDVPEAHRETVADIVLREITNFIKSKYVDNFEPVGPHDFETYKQELAKRGSRSVKWDYTKEQLELAAGSLQTYLAEVTGHAKVGECVGKAGEAKFTRSAIQRNIGKFDDETLNKLRQHLDNWAAWIAENDSDNAEDMEVIYYMWTATLDKHADKEVVDVSKFL